MSGFGTDNVEGNDGFTEINLTGPIGSALTRILMAEAIVPGSSPSYQLCKDIFAYHPLGGKLAETPIALVQSQDREISVPAAGEELLVSEFKRVWSTLGDGIGADKLIKSLKSQSRIYGIASIMMGDRNKPDDTDQPIDWSKLHETKPYFNVFDPLNTAGSLVLDQNPNSPDFQKPTAVRVGGRLYHPTRTIVVMNEQPLFIEWSDSAFGFSGRSVYQRGLFALKTYLQSLITDWLVTVKCGLLIYNANAPGSIQNNRVMRFFGWKRSQLKGGITGQVLTIGEKEAVTSLNFQNLEGPAKFARDNALKNIAMSASMPAKLLEQEEMVGGMAEGTEDAKQIARFIDELRIEMGREYAFFTRVCQHLAWTPAFYETLKKSYPETYGRVLYNTAFYQWQNSFLAVWPNLLAEPESKQIEVEKTRFESVVALLETMAPLLQTPENKARLAAWGADEISSRRKLFSNPLVIDEEAEANYEPPQPVGPEDAAKEPTPPAFSGRT